MTKKNIITCFVVILIIICIIFAIIYIKPKAKTQAMVNAYAEIINNLKDSEGSSEIPVQYNLIYLDSDNVPELVVGKDGYWVSIFTYVNNKVYTLADHWAYGAMGNAGYEYIEKGNTVYNRNSDYAGGIVYNTTLRVTKDYTLIPVFTEIEYNNFKDLNGNGKFDYEEAETFFTEDGDTSYKETKKEVESDENILPYSTEGTIAYITPDKSLENILSQLNSL